MNRLFPCLTSGASSWRGLVRQVLLLALLVAAVQAVAQREILFVQPWHEQGDYATNAFKIARAGQGREILGNYSRFDFCHPGPAFYYVYALGELVFLRGLHVVPGPYNAHVLAGVLLQSFFFAAALVMAAEWVRRPLFLPLALATEAIHFAFAGNAFFDLWPPRVLLMPFLCFLVGGASVAAGRWRDLPLTVLAGCFLVHGHVAQPLYVVPIVLLAAGIAWRKDDAAGWWSRGRALAIGAGVIALFIVPLAIDAAAGAQSNLARILEFELNYPGPPKSVARALVYFVGFFGYVKRPELFLKEFGPNRSAEIGEQPVAYFGWAAIIGAGGWLAWRLWRQRGESERGFVLALAGFVALAVGLSLQWGRAQIGSMFEYGGYVFYAILGAMLLLACAALSRLAVRRLAVAGGLLVAITVGALWKNQLLSSTTDYSTNQIPSQVQQALAADPRPEAPKYFVFTHRDWGEVVSIGLALQRTGHEFRADVFWGNRFTTGGGFEPAAPEFDFSGYSIWRLSHHGPKDSGSPMRDDMRMYFAPLPLDPSRAVIDCAENMNLELYTLLGFESPVGDGAWTTRPHAVLEFATPAVTSTVVVTFEAEPFAAPGRAPGQAMILSVNGREVFSGTLTAPGRLTARVPAEVWNARQPVRMAMYFPGTVEQRTLGRPLDRRQLGWRLKKILFETER